MRVAIIGCGGVGSQAARILAQAGHQVTILEQFTLDHDRGSSFGSSRIIRRTYPDRLYTQLMQAAYPLWEHFQHETDCPLFVRCGGLYFGRIGHPDLLAIEDALEHHHVTYDRLEAAEANRRFPALRLKKGEYGIYQQDSGFLRASLCVKLAAKTAISHGARLLENAPVLGIEPKAGAYEVRTTGETICVERILLSAGSWLSRFVPLPLTVTRQQYVHLKPQGDDSIYRSDNMPVWIAAGERAAEEPYGFPMDGDTPGVKIAIHHGGLQVDPDRVDRSLSAQTLEGIRSIATERLPGLSTEVVYEKTCLYTNTPDRDFIVDRHPDFEGCYLVGGLSGHGFKFTILLGQIAADLLTQGTTPHPLERFALKRFVR